MNTTNLHTISVCAGLFIVCVLNALGNTFEAVEMVAIPEGKFRPLYSFTDSSASQVDSFLIDKAPVTQEQFLSFVRNEPNWQRNQIKTIFADSHYLSDWPQENRITIGKEKFPVVNISWFAARAYCKSLKKRLPTLAEWEFVASAGEHSQNGSAEPEFKQRILNWYSVPSDSSMRPIGNNVCNYFGVCDLHGLIWEWVSDFSTALVTGESRGDSGLERGLFCGSASIGAGNFDDYAAFMRYGFRSSLKAHYTVKNLGFRCAQDL